MVAKSPWTNSPPEGWTNSPSEGWTNSPWTNSSPGGWTNSPWTNSPPEGWLNSPWTNSPPKGWSNSPLEGWTNSPWTNSPPEGWTNSPPEEWTNSPHKEWTNSPLEALGLIRLLLRIRLFIKGKKHGKMMLDSIDNGPLVYPTVEEDGQTRTKKYSELTKAQRLQDDCNVQATNIILHGLLPDVYALVNHQEAAKDIWDKVKLLMKGTELSYQERECRLYNLFDKFASVQGKKLYEYYWRFS
ncbi:hypothetical protein Tco_0155186 [Tanacetum coccineum]